MIITNRYERDTYSYKGKKEVRYKVIFEYEKSDGTTERITKRVRTQSDAKAELLRLEQEYARKGNRIEHRALLFRDYAETYKKTNLRKLKTHKGESAKVDLMIEFFGDIKLDQLRRSEIKKFKAFLETTKHLRTRKVWNKKTKQYEIKDASKPRTPRTVNTYLQRLRAILNEAETDEKILSAPSFKGLIDSHLEVRRDKTISYAEFERLLAACDVERGNHDRKHLKLVLIGLWELGCRKEELQKILVRDIDLDARIVMVWEAKRKMPKQRPCYISDRLLDALLENKVLDKPEDTRVFGESKYYARSFKTAKKIAGIDENFRLNDIRHCHITNKIQAGMDLVAVQKGVGHSAKSAMTLDVYTNLQPDYIKKAHQKFEEYSRQKLGN
jgi:integrase